MESMGRKGYLILFLLFMVGCGTRNHLPSKNRNTTASSSKQKELMHNEKIKYNIESDDREEGDRKTNEIQYTKREEAEKIKREIEELMQIEHGTLPELQSIGIEDSSSPPVIKITNDTDYELTVWLSGLCAQKIVLSPHKEYEMAFCPGNYIIAAKLNTPYIKPFIGKETLLEAGNKYFLTFFVMTPRDKKGSQGDNKQKQLKGGYDREEK